MALSRPLQPRDRRKRPARKGRAKAACAKTNTDWQLRKVRKILDTTLAIRKPTAFANDSIKRFCMSFIRLLSEKRYINLWRNYRRIWMNG